MGKGDRKPKPSSSSKAAELVSTAGTVKTGAGFGFGGFVGSRPISSSAAQLTTAVPALGASRGPPASSSAPLAEPHISSEVDSEVALHLHRLNKRDATTKTKALQMMRQLLSEKDADCVASALPSWSYNWAKLVMDNNRSVRLESCLVQQQICASAGRKLAPFLKSMMGPWLLAQCDPYAEAATAARTAYSTAFSGSKHKEAILYCRNEIHDYLKDTLQSSPQSLGDATKETPEELAERHSRVMSSTLGVVAMLAEMIAKEKSQTGDLGLAEAELITNLHHLLSAPHFFKQCLGSKSSDVRRSAYHMVATIANKYPDLLRDLVSESAPLVLGSLSEKEASNQVYMWSMLLTYVVAYPDCWTAANMRKAVLPRMYALLRHGCYGAPEASYPAVLPFLTRMPKDVVCADVMCEVVHSVWTGCDSIGVQQGKKAALDCCQEVMVWALTKLRAAEEGGLGQTQEYTQKLLGGFLASTVVPAAVKGASESSRSNARQLVTGILAALSNAAPSAGDVSSALQVVGSSMGNCVSETLSQGIADASSVPFEAARVMLEDMLAQIKHNKASVCRYVGVPLCGVLSPAVHCGTASAAASSLLAAVIGVCGAEVTTQQQQPIQQQQQQLPESAPSGHMTTSASFTLESVLQRTLEPGCSPSVAQANSDIMLSYLSQRENRAALFVQILCHLLGHATGPADVALSGAVSGADVSRRHGLAVLLLQRCALQWKDGQLPTDWRSAALDSLADELSAHDVLASRPEVPVLVGHLLRGDGTLSLLSETTVSRLLMHLGSVLEGQEDGPSSPPGHPLWDSALTTLVPSLYLPSTHPTKAALHAKFGILWRIFQLSWGALGPPEQHNVQRGGREGNDSSNSDSGEHSEYDEEDGIAEGASDLCLEASGSCAEAAAKLWEGGTRVSQMSGLDTDDKAACRQLFVENFKQQLVDDARAQEPKDWLWGLTWAQRLHQLVAATANTPQDQQEVAGKLLAGSSSWTQYAATRQEEASASGGSSSDTGAFGQAMRSFLAASCFTEGFAVVLGHPSPAKDDWRCWLALELLCACHHQSELQSHFAQPLAEFIAAHAEAAVQLLKECAAVCGPDSPARSCDAAVYGMCLLINQMASRGDASLQAVADFFREMFVEGSPCVPEWVVNSILESGVAQVFRSDTELLLSSGLPLLTQQRITTLTQLPPLAAAASTTTASDALHSVLCCLPIPDDITSATCSALPNECSAVLSEAHRQLRGLRAAITAAALQRRTTPDSALNSTRDPNSATDAQELISELVARVLLYCQAQLGSDDWPVLLAAVKGQLSGAVEYLHQSLVEVQAGIRRALDCIPGMQDAVGVQTVQAMSQLVAKGLLGRFPEAAEKAEELARVFTEDEGVLFGHAGAVLVSVAVCLDNEDRLVGKKQQTRPQTGSTPPSTTEDAPLVSMAAESAPPAAQLDHEDDDDDDDADSGFYNEWSHVRDDILAAVSHLVLSYGVLSGMAVALPRCVVEARGLWQDQQRALWKYVKRAVLAAVDGPAVVEEVVSGTEGWAEEYGVEATTGLLALVSEEQQGSSDLQEAALHLLLSPPLLQRITTVEALAEDDIDQLDSEGVDDPLAALNGLGAPHLLSSCLLRSAPLLPYLLCWSVMIGHMTTLQIGGPGRRRLAQALRDMQGVIPMLLDTLVRCLPCEPKGPKNRSTTSVGTPSPAQQRQTKSSMGAGSCAEASGSCSSTWDFVRELRNMGVPHNEAATVRLASLMYRAVLRCLPASARVWYSDLRDRGLSNWVEQYTVSQESPDIIREELALVADGSGHLSDDKFSIRANAANREVVAVINIEDGAAIGLAVRMSPATPLRPPEVECRQTVGVPQNRLRKWLLSINVFLRNQNGSVVDAIRLWKTNVDKEFEGVAECIICYSIIAPGSGQLPTLVCRTCKQRFHGMCLYKWFRSSGKSNCPHCQSPW